MRIPSSTKARMMPYTANPENPLPSLASILSTEFKPFLEVTEIVGFEIKLVGVEWQTPVELAKLMTALVEVGFLETSTDLKFVRLNPRIQKPSVF